MYFSSSSSPPIFTFLGGSLFCIRIFSVVWSLTFITTYSHYSLHFQTIFASSKARVSEPLSYAGILASIPHDL
ncbi:hypothetical protein F5B19DRAFT_444505 [Rostrohypoxylon terebratum]|nr:hypothetical protein F5B19DRAFT_444505 [Rostrohypoxylon terebratum]